MFFLSTNYRKEDIVQGSLDTVNTVTEAKEDLKSSFYKEMNNQNRCLLHLSLPT